MVTYGFCASLAEALVNARHDHIQFGQEVVGKIEFAVLQNVHFRAGEQAEVGSLPGQRLVDLFDFFELLTDSRGIQAVGLERGL